MVGGSDYPFCSALFQTPLHKFCQTLKFQVSKMYEIVRLTIIAQDKSIRSGISLARITIVYIVKCGNLFSFQIAYGQRLLVCMSAVQLYLFINV